MAAAVAWTTADGADKNVGRRGLTAPATIFIISLLL
jgi:hypothetical protein